MRLTAVNWSCKLTALGRRASHSVQDPWGCTWEQGECAGGWDANVAVTRGWVTSGSPERMRLACLTSSAGWQGSWIQDRLQKLLQLMAEQAEGLSPWWGAYVVSIKKLMVWPLSLWQLQSCQRSTPCCILISGHPPSFPNSFPEWSTRAKTDNQEGPPA